MSGGLDPDAQALLDVVEAMGLPPLQTLSVDAARERMRAAFVDRGPPIELTNVEDVALPSPDGALRCRLYRPSPGELPVALFLHGGGWTVNDLDTHDGLCRRIAARSGWLVASLDYRRAPEHKYPAALLDAYLAYRWLLDNAATIGGDAAHRALIGESSGANIVAALTLLLRDLRCPMPTYQVLAYPVTDRFDRHPSYREHGVGYALDRELMRWYLDHYLPPAHDENDPYLFPLAATSLAGLPPALVMTAEFDPLRDEGLAYAGRLAAEGVAVEHVHAGDQMHGFLMMHRAVRTAGDLIDQLAAALARRGPRPAAAPS
ncbi:MAG TPA: alpha/beta hydrolase [Solirubrobacteraceae bacterium]|nr:alpha/beta hydrolase [Solirubrobacteraceae bacterium]